MSNETTQADILIIDDMPENLEVLSQMLQQKGYNVRPAINGEIAIRAALKTPPDLILLDIDMPGMNGYEVCTRLKQDERTTAIPVIFVSAMSEQEDKMRAFRAGGVDYVAKPFHVEEVLARVEAQLTLYNQRREIERLMEKQQYYFEELNQMKDNLLSTASHDLKNPLNVIIGYANLLKTSDLCADPNFAAMSISEIIRAANRMTSLITDLLDLARLETGLALTPTAIDLNSFLYESMANHKFSAEQKSIELECVPLETDILINADHSRLSQVLNNLLSNAIKYTPNGGAVRLAAELDQNSVLIRVMDTGLGIPAESLPRLFEKFYRVPSKEHRSVDGTGLGLAIVKAIVEQHGGQIWVESESGKGSMFSIALPLQ
jgi:two-component system sensor histidine kinase/response regulator